MDEARERELLRAVRGEMAPEEAAELRRRLSEDPDLARRERALAEAWAALEPPPEAGVPPGFVAAVMSRAGDDGRNDLRWSVQPVWARLAAILALVAGIAAGVGATAALPGKPAGVGTAPAETTYAASLDDGDGLAESYLRSLEADGVGGGTETR